MDNPFAGLSNVTEVSEVVKTYLVSFEHKTIRVEVKRTFGLEEGREYMAVPDHALQLGTGAPFAPLRSYATPEEAIQELLYEFNHRYKPELGTEQWVPFPNW